MEKALLVVSFGTSYPETRKLTIEQVEKDLSAAFPDRKFFRAWTSRMIINAIRKKTGEQILSVSEALDEMLKEGIRDVLIQTTHFVPGIEYNRLLSDIDAFKDKFDSIRIGAPLLSSGEDRIKVAHVLRNKFDFIEKDSVLLFMGHGTDHPVNAVYDDINRIFREFRYDNFFLGTIEARPDISDTALWLREKNPSKIYLTPFMLVAGDHANNDLAGDKDDSWKSVLTREKYEVSAILKGMGEYDGIRAIYLDHAINAESV